MDASILTIKPLYDPKHKKKLREKKPIKLLQKDFNTLKKVNG